MALIQKLNIKERGIKTMAGIRTRSSYWGKTKEAIKRQRAGLIPGGEYQKRNVREIRYNCFWELSLLGDKQFIFYGSTGGKEIKDIPKEELKDKKYLNDWWVLLEFEDRKHIYWSMMGPLSQEEKAPILNEIKECMEKKLALLEKG